MTDQNEIGGLVAEDSSERQKPTWPSRRWVVGASIVMFIVALVTEDWPFALFTFGVVAIETRNRVACVLGSMAVLAAVALALLSSLATLR